MADMLMFPLDRTKGVTRVATVIGGALMTLICGAATLYMLVTCVVAPFLYDGGWTLLLFLLPGTAIPLWFTGGAGMLLEHMYTRVAVSEEGVKVLRPFRKKRSYAWSDFQQVCICFASSVPKGPSSSVLCFVCHGEKKNLYDRWKTDNPWHYRRLIVADHTTEIEEAVRNVCPMEIKELRGSIAYSYPEK